MVLRTHFTYFFYHGYLVFGVDDGVGGSDDGAQGPEDDEGVVENFTPCVHFVPVANKKINTITI